MARTPREVVEWIGEQYVERPTMPEGIKERNMAYRAFQEMAEENNRLFRNIPVEVTFQEDDPYDDYQDMKESVPEENRLRVFSGGAEHPIWAIHDEVTSRAVHDYWGHLELDVPFTVVGEYKKWEHSRGHYPVYCERYLFTEVIGQLGACYYLDDGFDDDRFEQKVLPAPGRWIDVMARAVEEVEG